MPTSLAGLLGAPHLFKPIAKFHLTLPSLASICYVEAFSHILLRGEMYNPSPIQ